jgi:putative hydrolase of the HAD superfamily
MAYYQYIFLDLDRTLWDFDTNSSNTLLDIINEFKLHTYIEKSEKWLKTYVKYNIQVWDLYEQRKISKKDLRLERFRLLLDDFNIPVDLTKSVSEYYISHSPLKTALMPHAVEVLKYLKSKYKLSIVSNGFYETQLKKLKASGLIDYFEKVFTSDLLKVAKPNVEIYREVVKNVNARKRNSLFIGDNLANDVVGPRKFGMDQVWYNHDNVKSDIHPTYEIKSLIELKHIL